MRLALVESGVEHLVFDAGGFVGGRLVVTVGRVGGHRPDLGGLLHRDRLIGVEQVRVLGDDLAVEQDLLEHHDVGPRQP